MNRPLPDPDDDEPDDLYPIPVEFGFVGGIGRWCS